MRTWPRSLKYDDSLEWWTGSVRLPILQSAKLEVPAPAPTRRSVKLTVSSDDERPSEAQASAFAYLRSNQERILDAALKSIAKWGRKTRHVYSTWQTEAQLELLLPRNVKPEQLMHRVRLYNIAIPDRDRRGTAYVEYSFGCSWDQEHGILVVLHQDREEFCGFTGSGW